MEHKYALSVSVLNGLICESYQSVLDIFIQVICVPVEWLENSDKQREKEEKRRKIYIYTLNESPTREARMWRTLNFSELRGLVVPPKSSEWFISSLFQMAEIKTQAGVSEHVLEGQTRIRFGAFCHELDGSGVRKVPLLMCHLLGCGCEKGKLVLWGLLFIQLLVLKQKGIE